MRIAIAFPGQGTQAPGMARAWKGHGAWAALTAAEAATGRDLTALVLDATNEDLATTSEAQIAVLATSLIAWEAARDALHSQHEIVGFAGHSLGQLTALIASGCLSADDGVRFAIARAAATQNCADRNPGRMAALVGATIEQAESACAAVTDAWVANDNAPGQVVIAGTPEGLDSAITYAKSIGVRKALPLAVGGAFHTPLMLPVTDDLARALIPVSFTTPSAPVVSNGDAVAHSDSDAWRERLIMHPTQTVRWRESMLALVHELGAEALIEIGYGSMIAGVAKRTIAPIAVHSIASPEAIDTCLAALSQARTAETNIEGST